MGNCMESEGILPVGNGVMEFKNNSGSIDIYFFPPSPPSRAALMVIKGLGLEHNVKMVNVPKGEHLQPDFLKMNPLHTIPVIDDKRFILYDSHVIMKYLVNQYGKDDALYPKDPKKEALVNLKCFFDACYLFPKFVDAHAPTLFHGKKPSEEALEALKTVLQHLNNFLENQLYVAGDNLTVADISIVTTIATIEACGSIDLRDYANIWMWYKRTKNDLKPFGYEEVNQEGANIFGQMYKSKLTEAK